MAHSVDRGYRLLAARYLRRQIKQLADQLDGIRAAEDIEFVHRARVATRRLRAALRLFEDCFPLRRIKRWRKAIRRITRQLGDARDCDVQIDYLCGVLSAATSKTCFPGIARLLVRLERRREWLQGRVVEAIRRLETSDVLHDIQRMTKRVLASTALPDVAIQSSAPFQRFERHILQRWAELSEHQVCLADPEDKRGHHAMRIAAKRLRYMVEIARPVYAGQLDNAVEGIKKVQSLLGEVHDCDVWLADLGRFACAERKRILSLFGHAGPFARLQVGIDYLREERQLRRRQVFDELVGYWDQLQRDGFGDRLGSVVRRDKTPLPSSDLNVSRAATDGARDPSDTSVSRVLPEVAAEPPVSS